jgi:hypothetical protein
MIRVSLTFLIYIYLLLFLAGIFCFWLLYEWRRGRETRRAMQFRVKCTICGMDYEDKEANPLPRCPRCGSLNERYSRGII